MVEVIASGPIHKNDGWSEDPCSVFVAHFVDSCMWKMKRFGDWGQQGVVKRSTLRFECMILKV